MPHKVQFMQTPATTVAAIRFHVSDGELSTIGERMGQALGTVMAELGKAAISPDGPAIAYYAPAADGFDVAAGFRVPPTTTTPAALERLDIGEVEVAHVTHVGPYSELPAAYDDLQTQTEAADRTVARGGPMWEEYWSEPATPENQTRTEIYWPLTAVSSARAHR
jgi:predicted transcriptional regulator YdeE